MSQQHQPPAVTEHLLRVSITRQEMVHFQGGKPVKAYRIATSRRPPSNVQDSLGTPLGVHQIADKIGAGAPLGMVFKGRVAQGVCFQDLPQEQNTPNLITTRILRLQGLEPGVNAGPGVDSYQRYIYIHGTNHEDRLGQPDSHGCILMSNLEVIELFDHIPAGTRVVIEV